jgi:hypothetical protein
MNHHHAPSGKLYFAYGSNLSHAQMRERCPQSTPVSAHVLAGYRLEFVSAGTQRWGEGGVATVVPDPGSSVPGALYRITPEDEARLDGFEGVNPAQPELGAYYKDETLLRYDGEPVLVYIATARLAEQGDHSPSLAYRSVINRGRRDWGQPELEAIAVTR